MTRNADYDPLYDAVDGLLAKGYGASVIARAVVNRLLRKARR